MKALVLSGGTANRFNGILHGTPKQLLPVLGKPVLFYGLEQFASAGIKEIYVVVSGKGERIRRVVGNGKRWGVTIRYIHQESPLGLGHAVKISQKHIGEAPFVLWLGDTLITEDFKKFIRHFTLRKPHALVLLGKTLKPCRCGTANVKDGVVTEIRENKRSVQSRHAIAGLYAFQNNIFEAIRAIQPSQRGELEITDAIQWLVKRSKKVLPYVTEKLWIDVGDAESYLRANLLMTGMP